MKHPMQPLERDNDGVIRFKQNAIIRWLVDHSAYDLNEIATRVQHDEFSQHDYTQLMQLIGYSVSGFGDLTGFVDDEAINDADAMVAELRKREQ